MTGIRRSAHRSRAGRNGARTLFTLAALLAVFLQAFAVQTHVHAYGLASTPIAAHASDNGETADDDAAYAFIAHEQAFCVVCQALASSGRALVPEAPAIALVASTTSEAAAIKIRDAPSAVAHSWQSRAPPIAL